MKPINRVVWMAVLAALVFAAVAAAFVFQRISDRNDGFRRDAQRIAEAVFWVRPYYSERYADERQFVAALLSRHSTAGELRRLAERLRERRNPDSKPDYQVALPSWEDSIGVPPTPPWQRDKLTKAEVEYYDTISRLRRIVWDYQQSAIARTVIVAAGSFILSLGAMLVAVRLFRPAVVYFRSRFRASLRAISHVSQAIQGKFH